MMEKAVLEKIGVLKRAYKEKEQAYEAEHKKLQAYVEKYLDENHIRGNKELLGMWSESCRTAGSAPTWLSVCMPCMIRRQNSGLGREMNRSRYRQAAGIWGSLAYAECPGMTPKY